MNNKPDINQLSPHLFWDIEKSNLSGTGSANVIIERVMEYGLMSDWKWIVSVYGEKKILETAMQLKNLSKLSANFLATIFKADIKNFACYKNNQSAHNYLNY